MAGTWERAFQSQWLGRRIRCKLFKIKDPDQVLSFTWRVGICHTYKPKLRKLKSIYLRAKTTTQSGAAMLSIITQFKRLRQEGHGLEGNVTHRETMPQSQRIIPSAVMLLCSVTVYAGQHIKFAIAHIHATRINPQTPRAASEARTPFRSCARARV